MSPRRSPSALKTFPPLLYRLVRAAEAECPPGHAEALTAFISLALHRAPVHIVSISGGPSDPELASAIESVAKAHFELDQALATWRGALKATDLAVKSADDNASAAFVSQDESETAYFYAGLAFGLVFAGPQAVTA